MTNLALQKTTLMFGDWTKLKSEHEERAKALTKARLERAKSGEVEPVEDFLFNYYSYRPALLNRWHPGAGIVLEDSGTERLDWRWYRTIDNNTELDCSTLYQSRGKTVSYILKLLELTLNRPARFGCFGLHEWAMVYKQNSRELRHQQLPLRLSPDETNQVVEENNIHCSHFDAFRFFTPEAEPLNRLKPTRDEALEFEQSGCLHANMDIYKWAIKLGPIVPGSLLLDSFELAREIRVVDMQASPYDLSKSGLAPIAIETTEGKTEYQARQEAFSLRANQLRQKLIKAVKTFQEFSEAELATDTVVGVQNG